MGEWYSLYSCIYGSISIEADDSGDDCGDVSFATMPRLLPLASCLAFICLFGVADVVYRFINGCFDSIDFCAQKNNRKSLRLFFCVFPHII